MVSKSIFGCSILCLCIFSITIIAASTSIPKATISAKSVIRFTLSPNINPINKVKDKIIGTVKDTIIASLNPKVKISKIKMMIIEINRSFIKAFTALFAVYPSSLVIVNSIFFSCKDCFILFKYSKICSFITTLFAPFNFEAIRVI